MPRQENVYDPWNDSDYLTPEQKYNNFQHWVSSYYDHPDVASGKPSGLSVEKRTDKRTYATWTEEQRAAYCDIAAAVRSEHPAYVHAIYSILV
jgi:hypothetical protein